MSSLVALVDWSDALASESCVDRLIRAAPYRHPDGIWKASVGAASLGFGLRAATHRQLACASPIWCEAGGDVAVLCDARLDNLDQLVRELGIPEGAGTSDAEVIGRAYRRWELDAATHLDGDFAFVVWDRGRRRVYAARDRFGLRSLHYRTTGRFLVATEVGQILADPETPRDIDPNAVLHHLTWEYGQHRRTFFSAIRRIEPGHFLLAARDGQTQVRYWSPRLSTSVRGTSDDYAREFELIFRGAVAERLDCPTPITMHLSGGLDSSSIVCVASRLAKQTPSRFPFMTAVSAIFPGLDCDESSFIESVRTNTDVPSLRWNGVASQASPDALVSGPAAPFGKIGGMGGAPPEDLEITRRLGARVLLSGEGGNQITTEPRFLETLIRDRHWQGCWSQVVGVVQRGGPSKENLAHAIHLMWAAKRALLPVELGELVSEYRRRSAWRTRPAPRWLGTTLRRLWPGPVPDRDRAPYPNWSARQQDLWACLRDPRHEWVMDMWDGNAAHFGIEARFPFLDTTLAEFMLALPVPIVTRFGQPRGVHKAALRGVIPGDVLERPWGVFFNSAQIANVAPLIPSIRRVLNEGPWASAAYVDRASACQLLDGLGVPTADSWREWALLRDIAALEIWVRAM